MMGCLPPINWCRISSIHSSSHVPSVPLPLPQAHPPLQPWWVVGKNTLTCDETLPAKVWGWRFSSSQVDWVRLRDTSLIQLLRKRHVISVDLLVDASNQSYELSSSRIWCDFQAPLYPEASEWGLPSRCSKQSLLHSLYLPTSILTKLKSWHVIVSGFLVGNCCHLVI